MQVEAKTLSVKIFALKYLHISTEIYDHDVKIFHLVEFSELIRGLWAHREVFS